jgi:hypothetical protein
MQIGLFVSFDMPAFPYVANWQTVIQKLFWNFVVGNASNDNLMVSQIINLEFWTIKVSWTNCSEYRRCILSELPSLTVYPWVSRFSHWPPGLTVGLENLTESIKMVLYAWILHLCSEKNTICKNTVCSFERKSVRICKMTLLLKKLAVWLFE